MKKNGSFFVIYFGLKGFDMSQRLFGTDGIRGIAGTFPMTPELIFRLAKVLSILICQNQKRVAIGKDTRVSSYMLEAALTAGFTSMGIDVVKMRVVPTPLMTSQITDLNVDMGLMITASHNPYQDNGIKLIDQYGDKFSDLWTQKIEELLISDESFPNSSQTLGKVYKDKISVPTYIQNVLSISPYPDALKGLRLVLDCANGAFSKIMPQVFKNLGAGIITLSAEPNGYNINENCGSEHIEHLCQVVQESHADLGIAVDGDGDRLIIIDSEGQKVDGDQIIAFLADFLKKHNKLSANTVITTIWSNMGLEKYLHGLGIDVHKTPVGERYVIEEMRKTHANIGGEESGHIVLSDYARTGDALIAALLTCLAFKEDGRNSCTIFPVFKKYPCSIHQIHFKTKEEASQVFDSPEMDQILNEAKDQLKDRGTIIIRPSGTEPKIKIRIEGENETFIQKLGLKLENTIEKLRR